MKEGREGVSPEGRSLDAAPRSGAGAGAKMSSKEGMAAGGAVGAPVTAGASWVTSAGVGTSSNCCPSGWTGNHGDRCSSLAMMQGYVLMRV